MLIRILLLIGLGATGWLVFLRRNRLPFHIVTVFLLLGVGGIAVLFPELANDLAHFAGVGRGADLITYIAIVGVMFVLIHYYTKFVELQQQVTELTRALALLRAELERSSPPVASTKPASLDPGRSALS